MAIKGAWEEYIESEEGKRSADISTLPSGQAGQVYLENRLWRAFFAGRAAAERAAKGAK